MNQFDHILFIGFGGPEKPGDIRPFLEEVTRGLPIPKERLDDVAHHYTAIGGRSPYNEYTYRLIEKVKAALKANGVELPIFVGMKNWHPFLKDTLTEIKHRGLKRGVGVILASQRCDASYEKYIRAVDDAKKESGAAAEYIYLPNWHSMDGFISAQTGRLRDVFSKLSEDGLEEVEIIFCAHSVPVDMAQKSRYAEEFVEGARRVAEKLGHKKWRIAYQSRSGSPRQPWLEPDVCSVIAKLPDEGIKTAVLVPIGFLCDNAEVLYDLDIEAKKACEEAGINYLRALTVMDHPDFVAMLARLIHEQMK